MTHYPFIHYIHVDCALNQFVRLFSYLSSQAESTASSTMYLKLWKLSAWSVHHCTLLFSVTLSKCIIWVFSVWTHYLHCLYLNMNRIVYKCMYLGGTLELQALMLWKYTVFQQIDLSLCGRSVCQTPLMLRSFECFCCVAGSCCDTWNITRDFSMSVLFSTIGGFNIACSHCTLWVNVSVNSFLLPILLLQLDIWLK